MTASPPAVDARDLKAAAAAAPAVWTTPGKSTKHAQGRHQPLDGVGGGDANEDVEDAQECPRQERWSSTVETMLESPSSKQPPRGAAAAASAAAARTTVEFLVPGPPSNAHAHADPDTPRTESELLASPQRPQTTAVGSDRLFLPPPSQSMHHRNPLPPPTTASVFQTPQRPARSFSNAPLPMGATPVGAGHKYASGTCAAYPQQQQQSTGALLRKKMAFHTSSADGSNNTSGFSHSFSLSNTASHHHSNTSLPIQPTPETPSKRNLQSLPFSSPIDPNFFKSTIALSSDSNPPPEFARMDSVKKHKQEHETLFLETPSKPVLGSSSTGTGGGCVASSAFYSPQQLQHPSSSTSISSRKPPFSPVHHQHRSNAAMLCPQSPMRTTKPGMRFSPLRSSPHGRPSSAAGGFGPFSPLRNVAWTPKRSRSKSSMHHATLQDMSLDGEDTSGDDKILTSPHREMRSLLSTSTLLDGGVRSSSSLLELLHRCSSPGNENVQPHSHLQNQATADVHQQEEAFSDMDTSGMNHSAIMGSDVSMLMDDDNDDEHSDDAFGKKMHTPSCSRPPPPSIIWSTPFVHFLDRSYFEKLRESVSGGGGYLLPIPPSNFDTPKDCFLNYFETRFLVMDQIGHGYSADVFRVKSPGSQKIYAVKKSRHPFGGYKDRLKQLEEVELLWRIGQHPHVIDLVNAWEQHGHLYLQTDFYELGSLEAFLVDPANMPLSELQLWNAIADLVLGLSHIHERNIVHLDLKPSNVFIARGYSLKIGDFGMAASLDHPIDDREGDRNYMAPEILEGRYGKPADIFSLGLIILEMTANVALPESGEAYHKLRRGDLADVPFDPETTSNELISLIASMLVGEPEKRPTVEQLLFHPQIASIVYARMKQEEEIVEGV